MPHKKEKIDFKYNLSVYYTFIRPYLWLAALVLVVNFVFELTLTLDKILFKFVIDDGTSFVGGTMSRELFVSALLMISIYFLLIIFSRSVLRFLQLHFTNRLEAKMIFDMKKRYFLHLVMLSHDFHTSHKSGSLIARLSRGGRALEMFTDVAIFEFAPFVFQFVVVSVSLAYFSSTYVYVALGTSIVFLAFSLFMQQIEMRYTLVENNADDTEKGFIGDVFTNVDAIKYYGKEKSIGSRYEGKAGATRDAQRAHWDVGRYTWLGQNTIIGIGTFLIVFFPIRDLIAGSITIGSVVFVFTTYGNLTNPLHGFVRGVRNFYRSMADFESLFRYGKISQSVKDGGDVKPISISNGTVAFRNVSFSYNSKREVIQDFNLDIKAGEKVALVGHSGSGKTTVVKLLYRFYDVTKGEILIDGSDVRNVSQESLRSEMSIVPQECVLFDDTIYNNVAFSKPDASRDEVMQALKFAQIDRIIEEFPDKEQTIVGERGVKLSGGEKQRVSIARAILANKKIIVLDEATSSLDSVTESDIQRDLAALLSGRTSIIIAHRLSTIMKADRVIVLHKGKIVEEGTHFSLVDKKGHYHRLWELQRNGYII
ncbi:MAG TPA: metal ABC transporter permease [Lentisphaeria bacterium]|nr:MAG: hypothetical protein A2X45_12990 [Lentisphaerae bacterium GWF2_50_93]HCE42523.1 metal ABC transporter permease [Lentisphaeria bacterium]